MALVWVVAANYIRGYFPANSFTDGETNLADDDKD